MPNYTYHCDYCGEEFDRRQGFNDEPLKKCPNCKKHALRKLYKPARIVFKGSGFYATDSRSGSGSNKVSAARDKSNENGKEPDKKKEKKADKGGEKKNSGREEAREINCC